MKKFMEEFKAFAVRGNVIDMAVGVVIGGAFGKISTSIVNDIIMPVVSMITGGVDFQSWKIVLKEAAIGADGLPDLTTEVAIKFGSTIAVIVDFIIVAFAIFCMIKFLNNLHKKEEAVEEPAPEPEAEPAPPAPTSEELLAEIRDLLKEKR